MKDLSKLIVISVFAMFGFGLFVHSTYSKIGTTVSAKTDVQPTPTPETPMAKPTATPAATMTTPTPAATTASPTPATPMAGDKTMTKNFTLGTDSFSKEGEVAFNHDTHAFQKYSPDGQSVVGCVECHHTDQPKSALKPPLILSERAEVLNFDNWQKSTQKVALCRACHFQDGEEPDGKEMPVATYPNGSTKELNNEEAYHINCNTCHDNAAKLRPDLKKKAGFATTNDCFICHKEN